MTTRKGLSKKVRFEVFKRDNFKCQYCGSSAPEVILHIDHIQPVSTGGENHLMNLITSCINCNQGKRNTPLDDKSALEKQRRQLEELNERRNQLEMMLLWREGMASLTDRQVEEIERVFTAACGHTFSDYGRQTAKRWLKKYPMNMIFDAMETAKKYLVLQKNKKYSTESINKFFNMTERIAEVERITQEKPYWRDISIIRGILNKRINHSFNHHECLSRLEDVVLKGADIQSLKSVALQISTWREFTEIVDKFLEGKNAQN